MSSSVSHLNPNLRVTTATVQQNGHESNEFCRDDDPHKHILDIETVALAHIRNP